MVRELVDEVHAEVVRNYGPWLNTTTDSAPVYVVPAAQPRMKVTLDEAGWGGAQEAFDAVPIPPGARPAAGSDRHMVIWQPSSDTMWEFFRVEERSDGWHARCAGAIQHLSSDPGYYTSIAWPGAQPWWGATATGLPLIGGMITLRDLKLGQVDHALAMAIPHARAGTWSWPATHGDGNSSHPNSLPEGARLRLDPSLNIDSLHLPPLTKMLAEAAQRYGIVLRDQSSIVTFYGEDPTPTGTDPWQSTHLAESLNSLIGQFPWKHLQVLRLRLVDPSAPH